MNFKQYSRLRSSVSNQFVSLLLLCLFASSSLFSQVDQAKWKEGRDLFKGNCAACHNPKSDGTGPALGGVTERWKAAGDHKGKSGDQWLRVWIKNYNDAVNSGYKYAVDMANSRPAQMNVFASLSDQQIDLMLYYIDNYDKGGPSTPATTSTATPVAGATEHSKPDWALYAFVILLISLVAILMGVNKKLENIISEKKGEVVVDTAPFYKSPKFITFAILVGIVYLGYITADATISLGRQQGYQPTQPIRFSHELHAGKHKIDCQYCHNTANQGKHSNIPSLNTCMNCHKNVTKGPEFGTEEISKIYAAVGWDAYTQTYSKPSKPVEWVRIHNLPDHVYFNHSQHVNAGKVACQTCHGPVETMKEVYQYAPLSMGWCINCHRQTEVQFASNNYYSTYEKLHQDVKDGKVDRVTVEKIGGTECQRCHY